MARFYTAVIKMGRVARLVLIASALCVAAASNGHAACTAATTHTLSPAACGVVISTAGCYNMTTSLIATSNTGDCIQITAPNVYLNLTGVSNQRYRRSQHWQWNPRYVNRCRSHHRGRFC